MNDWRRIASGGENRSQQQTAGGQNKGLFVGVVDSAGAEAGTIKVNYAGGSRAMPGAYPFQSTNAWIRSIPESGCSALLGTRSDTGEVCFLRWLDDRADKRADFYKEKIGLTRPLLPGEHEIHSAGLAQSYYAARPLLEQRGGAIRSWLDQDKAEAGSKAPTHVRQLWEHNSNELGDEERFGAVKRPYYLNPLSAAYLSLLNKTITFTSWNKEEYPFPDFSLPGGVPAAFSLAATALAKASEITSIVTGGFKKRPFAKEYTRILKNPLSPLPPSKLVDIREGHVFADTKVPLDGTIVTPTGQILGSNMTYLRAKYEYYTTLGDSTKIEIDDLGNVTHKLSLAAIMGYNTQVPLGAWKLFTGLGVDVKTLMDISMRSTLGTSINALTTMDLGSLLNMSLDSKMNISQTCLLNYSADAKMNASVKGNLNLTAEAGIIGELKAGVQANIKAPIVQIGGQPSTPCVLGTELTTWLQTFLNALLTAAPQFCMGNLGYPTILNPQVQTAISQAISTMPTFLSKTITVSQ